MSSIQEQSSAMVSPSFSSLLKAYESALELRQVNERLVLAGLREHELAERADEATREVVRLLARKSYLAEASSALTRSLDLSTTLQVAARLAFPILADSCLVRLVDDGARSPFALAHADAQRCARLQSSAAELAYALDADELVRRVVESGEVVRLVPEPGPLVLSSGTGTSLWAAVDAHSVVALPLTARGSVFAVLMLVACSASRSYGPEELELARALAQCISVSLDNARLYRAAQNAIRIREDVMAIVSHDLSNPLGVIAMSVHRLQRHLPPEQVTSVSAWLSLIQRSSKHMRRLIEELLEVASLEAGQLVLQRRDVRPEELLAEAVDMLAPQARDRGIELTSSINGSFSLLSCDVERVIRVLVNLGGNALKFTPRGGHVRLSVQNVAAGIQFEVADNGPGIELADQAKLFDRYWKGRQSGRRGMGLGLYIARGIVDAHGGSISVHSQPPHGATFRFVLPR